VRRRALAALGLLALCGARHRAAAAAPPLRLLTGQYPPYEYEEDGQARGMVVEIVREAFRRAGRPVQVEVMPWARALQETQAGRADGLFAAVKTPERERQLAYTQEPLVPLVVSLFVRQGAAVRYEGPLAPLAGLRFGVVNRFSNGALFDGAVAAGTLPHVEVANSTESNIRKLLAGRIDVMVNNRYGARYHLRRLGLQGQVQELPMPVDASPSYLALSRLRDDAALRAAFDKALAAMKADGSFQRIVDAHSR
jgi:polar amino acid transport system substrate-binding protein